MTRVGLSRQISDVQAQTFHGASPDFHMSFKNLIFAVRIHGLEEAFVVICHQLAFRRKTFQRLPFENTFVAVQVVEDLLRRNTK